MSKRQKSSPPWAKIKKDYLQGIPPRDLARKYKLTAKQISDKANKEGWVRKKAEISEKVEQKVEATLEGVQNLALLAAEKALKEFLEGKKSLSKGSILLLSTALKQAWPNKDNQKTKKRELPEDVRRMSPDDLMDAINEYLE